ncbi:hypothetical protein ACWGI8_24640 [Streptomyces sp. NPDC054841]
MDFVTRLLGWVTVALLGRRTPGRHRAQVPQAAAQAHAQLSPDVWGAGLGAARMHREGRAPCVPTLPEPRAQWFPPAPWERPMTLVRPYLLCHLGEEWRYVVAGRVA